MMTRAKQNGAGAEQSTARATQGLPQRAIREIIEPATSDKTEPTILILDRDSPAEAGLSVWFEATKDGRSMMLANREELPGRPISLLTDSTQAEEGTTTQGWTDTKAITEPGRYFRGAWAVAVHQPKEAGVLQDLPFRSINTETVALIEKVSDPVPEFSLTQRPLRALNNRENKAAAALRKLYKELEQYHTKILYFEDCHKAGVIPDMGQKPIRVYSLPEHCDYPTWLRETLETESNKYYKSLAATQALGLTVAQEHTCEKIKVLRALILKEFGEEAAKDIISHALAFSRAPRRKLPEAQPVLEYTKRSKKKKEDPLAAVIDTWQQVLETEETPAVETEPAPRVDGIPTVRGETPEQTDLQSIAKSLKALVDRVARLETSPRNGPNNRRRRPKRKRTEEQTNGESRRNDNRYNNRDYNRNTNRRETRNEDSRGYRSYRNESPHNRNKDSNNRFFGNSNRDRRREETDRDRDRRR